jgi:PAS domain S-box-containing protein
VAVSPDDGQSRYGQAVLTGLSARLKSSHFFIFFIIALTFSLLATVPAAADARTVNVGVYENAPKVFTSESGRPSGIFIDVIEDIAKSEGWNLRYVHGTWAEGLDRLAKGEIDLMTDVAYTTEREKMYSFHKVPVLSVWSQVYARKGSGIQSILDLNGKRIAALEQTIQLETFRRLTNSFGLKITLIPVPDYETEFKMIAEGKADAGVTNRFYGLMHARKSGLEDTPVMFDPAPFFFAAAKGDPKHLLDTIDSRLSELKRDPRSAYYTSLKRWTSEEVQFKLPSWMQIAGLVFGVMLLMSLAGSLVLRYQVNERTRQLKQINAELRSGEEKFFKAFHATPDAIVMSRAADGLLLEVNEVFLAESGYSRDEAVNHTTIDLNLWVEPGDRERYSATLREHGKVRDMEARFRTKSGKILDGLVSGESILLNNESCILTIIRNITERKKTEAELEKHRLHLEDMVEIRTSELSAANKKLKELDTLKSMFIASMSHELRTPLNSIIGFTGMTLQGMSGELNEEQKDNLTRAYFSARHLLDLITDVIDISKIEAGRVEAFPEEFSIREAVDDAVATVGPQLKDKGLALEVDVPADIRVNTDRKRLLQCLINFLSNAVKFTESGRITVVSRVTDKQVSLSVSDTGIGIGEKDIPRLFEPFERLETHLRVKAGGTGLGLYLTKKLVTDILRGSISVQSAVGQGSTFTIGIPRDIRTGI